MTSIHVGIGLNISNEIRVSLHANATASTEDTYQPSAAAMRALSAIGGSTKLSKEQKRTLTHLIAMVDEYAGGSPKLMRAIIGIANVMAMQSHKTYPPTPLQEMLKMYQEERAKLARNHATPDVAQQITALHNIISTDISSSDVAQPTQTDGISIEA